jgi:Nuclease-related domain.
MANIINETNHLEDEYKSKIRKRNILFGVFIINFLLILKIPIVSLPVEIVLFFLIGSATNQCKIAKSGLDGERSALEVLSSLGSEYHVVSDLEIEFDGKKSQIDSVIIGKNGVFVMETKNVKGCIVGTEQDQNVTVHKVGRNGGEYSNTVYNPCKQVGTHVFRLSKMLQEKGLNPWVQGMVYFSNTETEVQLQASKIPVFSCADNGAERIGTYITNYQGRTISNQDQQKIVGILTKYIMKK